MDLFYLFLAIILVILNGFYVAAEFALVKLRPAQVDRMVEEKRPFAKAAQWLAQRMDRTLSACQLGITMASLALGWVGEPAFHHLLNPLFENIGINSEAVSHTLAFIVSFTTITALHLVIGEQVPKIYAIREPEKVFLWCAVPMKISYLLLYPFQASLSWVTAVLLKWMGVEGSGHDSPMTEEEIRTMLTEAHLHGELTRSEHSLIHAVFEFDDMVCRRVMVPRSDVDFFDVDHSLEECMAMAQRTKHTRYPLCQGSMDNVLGVVHIKDLTGVAPDDDLDLKDIMRPPNKIPEFMPISRLLRHFQATQQLMAFVIDEHGTVLGIVTLENVLERIVGPVDDEFDITEHPIVPAGNNEFIVQGATPIQDVEKVIGINLDDNDVDTVSGVLMTRGQKLPEVGDVFEFAGATAEILAVRDDRADKILFRLENEPKQDGGNPNTDEKDSED